jgi:hypothetical protein
MINAGMKTTVLVYIPLCIYLHACMGSSTDRSSSLLRCFRIFPIDCIQEYRSFAETEIIFISSNKLTDVSHVSQRVTSYRAMSHMHHHRTQRPIIELLKWSSLVHQVLQHGILKS